MASAQQPILFLEEAIGPDAPEGFKELRRRIDIPVYGGEIITTPKEMITRMRDGVYDGVQPDASVMGGISAVMDIFAAARETGTRVVVHAWGGAAAIMASYHAAFAAGGDLVEYPMLDFPLGRRDDRRSGQDRGWPADAAHGAGHRRHPHARDGGALSPSIRAPSTAVRSSTSVRPPTSTGSAEIRCGWRRS